MNSEISMHNRPSPSPVGHYSHGCSAAGLLFISGQLPVTPEGELSDKASFEEQAKQVLDNLESCLAAGNSRKELLVMVRIYLTNMANWPAFNEIYARWLGNWKPARAVVGVAELHYGVALEIEAIAKTGSESLTEKSAELSIKTDK